MQLTDIDPFTQIVRILLAVVGLKKRIESHLIYRKVNDMWKGKD